MLSATTATIPVKGTGSNGKKQRIYKNRREKRAKVGNVGIVPQSMVPGGSREI